MKILYCRIGWMNNYNGHVNDIPQGGGAYNKTNVGHEIYNFSSYDENYYGYVQPPHKDTIKLERITKRKEDEKIQCISDVLVVWVARKPNFGQVIIGWYKNATVYRHYQYVKEEVLAEREYKYDEYSIYSKDATLLPSDLRNKPIKEMGRANTWFGEDSINEDVLKYIYDYENQLDIEIKKINEIVEDFNGYEKETLIKARVNQSFFRNKLLLKYKHCCLCGIDNDDLLLASHIKPWAKSDSNEKLNVYNGLLLCSMHDKLFDLGYISFENNGNIIISNELNERNRIFSNVNEKMCIKIEEDNIPFIEYHRKNILKR